MASQLLINEPPLQVLPTLARKIGLNEAIVLQQIHYWLSPQLNKNLFEGRYWVRNTYGQFSFWGEKTIRRTIMNLEESKLLISFVTAGFHKVKYYTINYACLEQMSSLSPDNVNNSPANTLQKVNFGKAVERQGSRSSGHNDQIDLPKRADAWGQLDPTEVDDFPLKRTPEFEKCEQISGFHSSGQNDPIDLPKRADRCGQVDQIDRANLTRHSENTPENTYLPPPLTPPPRVSLFGKDEEEEEEQEKIYFGFKNANENSERHRFQAEGKAIEENTMDEREEKNHEAQVFQEMIGVWNRIVQEKLNPGQDARFTGAHLTDKRKALLKQFLEGFLACKAESEQLSAWENYCTLIAQSRFLLGQNPSGFKVTLDWALLPDNASKVLEGAIYDKPEPIKASPVLPWEEFSEGLAKTLPSSPYLSQWLKISVTLAKLMGQEKYRSRFAKVSLKELTETQAIFSVEGSVARDSLVRNYSSEIRCAVQAHYPTVSQIDFETVSEGGIA